MIIFEYVTSLNIRNVIALINHYVIILTNLIISQHVPYKAH